jgi:hypothetical protein
MRQGDPGVPVDANAVIALLRQRIGELSVEVAVQTARAVQAETELTAKLPAPEVLGG